MVVERAKNGRCLLPLFERGGEHFVVLHGLKKKGAGGKCTIPLKAILKTQNKENQILGSGAEGHDRAYCLDPLSPFRERVSPTSFGTRSKFSQVAAGGEVEARGA